MPAFSTSEETSLVTSARSSIDSSGNPNHRRFPGGATRFTVHSPIDSSVDECDEPSSTTVEKEPNRSAEFFCNSPKVVLETRSDITLLPPGNLCNSGTFLYVIEVCVPEDDLLTPQFQPLRSRDNATEIDQVCRLHPALFC